ncbi:hypothetical protein [Methylobacterium symbioticum]|uniref:Uncharacterized protein n=1 Tax=Methylobacterium symbioticum TaxID=2584084 RepID=A0A509EGG0_9HYPH|nr:hypothetical protein [Methylobacterium symbioticum]VUD73152.1 hypothetical protein MET9862_03766 [Methylobacterium symbioticum]
MIAPFARAALFLAVAGLSCATPLPAAAESPAQAYQYGRQFRNACRPPLKYAAGACVRRCPAGFQDNGRTCRYRTMRW